MNEQFPKTLLDFTRQIADRIKASYEGDKVNQAVGVRTAISVGSASSQSAGKCPCQHEHC